MTDERASGPGVHFPPPFLFVGGFVIAWALDAYVTRFRFIRDDGSTSPIETAGIFLAALGILLMIWGMVTFLRARTAIIPFNPASRLVESGPYRVSRNPMYTGMSLVYLGGMLILNLAWALVLFPVVIALLYRFVIQKEERYLHARFGDAYTSYTRRVRRWI